MFGQNRSAEEGTAFERFPAFLNRCTPMCASRSMNRG